MFQAIAPKPPQLSSSLLVQLPQPLNVVTSPKSCQRRTLPASFSKGDQSQAAVSRLSPEESEEVSLLSSCGLQAFKVTKEIIFLIAASYP